MKLAEALYRAVSDGVTPPDDRNRDYLESMAILEARYGGPTKAAKAVGVHYSRWKRWKKGEGHSGASFDKMMATLRRSSAEGKKRERLLRGGGTLKINAKFAAGGDEREREIDLSAYVTRATRQKMLDAYDAGDYRAMARTFLTDGLWGDYVGLAGDDGDYSIVPVEVFDLTWA